VSTIPAGVLGILFEEKLKLLFASPKPVAIFLLLNGTVLYGAEVLRKRAISREGSAGSDGQIARMSWIEAIKIGLLQCLALLPGFSRTGATLGGGLLVGLSHSDAARYSFLMATPIIFAASVLEIPSLALSGRPEIIGPAIVAALCAALAAYFSVTFLTKYFKTKTLTPFAIYCGILGLAAALVL
jgi:undecaprenyl-diphosphatase